MAIYRIFPEKDTFIYTEKELANLGRDEILEVAGYFTSTAGQTSRALLQFDTIEIQDTLNNKAGVGTDFSASLKMFLAYANELPVTYSLFCYPISQSWDEGVGKFGDLPINKSGCSWEYTKAGAAVLWETGSYNTYVTASFLDAAKGGAAWYTASADYNLEVTQSHNKTSNHDANLDVTNAINLFYSESLENNGFIVKLEDSIENNQTSSIRLKYYSSDTNTIYPPYLELKWDDFTYSTGSLSTISDAEALISIRNAKDRYTDEGKNRFRVHVRPKYPTRTFATASIYTTNYLLPTASYWGLRDEHTEEMVVDYDTTFTKISADGTSNYFDVYMDGLQPERYYRLLIKTTIDGNTNVIDNGQVFKVVRNG